MRFWPLDVLKRRREQAKAGAEAYELGRTVALRYTEAIDAFLTKRFDTLNDGYLDVFVAQLKRTQSEPPPAGFHRGQVYEADRIIYNGQVDALRDMVRAEIWKLLAEHVDALNEIGFTEKIDEYIYSRIDRYLAEMRKAGDLLYAAAVHAERSEQDSRDR